LALSIDSPHQEATDCFLIDSTDNGEDCQIKATKRLFAPVGTTNFGIAVSPLRGDVVLLDEKGTVVHRGLAEMQGIFSSKGRELRRVYQP
jgi:hypothetical protein